MRSRILAATGLMLLAGLLAYAWLSARANKRPIPGQTQAAQDHAAAKALNSASPQAAAAIASNFAVPAQTIFYTLPPKPQLAPAGPPAPLEFTNFPPEIALENLRHAIRDYGSMFDGNPVGENSEIASQLNGHNPKQVNFIQADAGLRLNGEGQLVDPWGTPYFFHQLSGREMEIHSAGPDKVMWTADDLVTK